MPPYPSILIKNATMVNEGNICSVDLLIRHGRIDRIDRMIDASADIVIDATNKILLPGMIDCHVHFREPGLTHKGDMQSESRAAVAGGVTSVMEMPNTIPPCLAPEQLEEKFSIAAQKMIVNYSFYLGATPSNLEAIKTINSQKVCGVKIYMGSSTGNMLVDSIQTLEKIFRDCPVPIAIHCEDANLIRKNENFFHEKQGEKIPFSAHPKIRSAEACFRSSRLAVGLAHKHGTRLHLLHISTAKELELFENSAKRITAEACVHYLHFDDGAYENKGALIKCNPAIKTAVDRAALLDGLLSDRIDTIGTDHAPHTLKEKQGTYWTAPSGLPVIQSALPSVLEHVHNGVLSLETIVEKIAHNPARIFQIKNRGFIREGYWADLVLVDLNAPQMVEKKNIFYLCGWSPFEGVLFHSSVDTTIVSGRIAWQKGSIKNAVFGQRLEFDR